MFININEIHIDSKCRCLELIWPALIQINGGGHAIIQKKKRNKACQNDVILRTNEWATLFFVVPHI